METTIFLGREVLEGDCESLRRVLLAHTGCEKTATELLLTLDRSRRDGQVGYCVLRATDGHPDTGSRSWSFRFGAEVAA